MRLFDVAILKLLFAGVAEALIVWFGPGPEGGVHVKEQLPVRAPLPLGTTRETVQVVAGLQPLVQAPPPAAGVIVTAVGFAHAPPPEEFELTE